MLPVSTRRSKKLLPKLSMIDRSYLVQICSSFSSLCCNTTTEKKADGFFSTPKCSLVKCERCFGGFLTFLEHDSDVGQIL